MTNTIETNIYKRNDAQFIFSSIAREINNVTDGDKTTKKASMTNLYNFIVNDKPSIQQEIIQEILIAFNKNLLKLSLFDPIDKCRELSIKILIYLYSNCTQLGKFLPFVFSALVDKFNCEDIEGTGALPEEIRPTPSQKPNIVTNLTEQVEEIRVLYVKLLETITLANETVVRDDFRIFVNDIVNITRVLTMDPCQSVTLEACRFVAALAVHFNKELLFHFNSIMSRSLFYALTHKQAKLRIAALDALDKLMLCSPFKKNVEIIEQLIGFRDPNMVPIKDFYEPSHKLNYFAMFVTDPNGAVGRKFYEVITNWLITLEDRFDHEARLIPYVLTGLFDSNDEIALYVAERMDSIGLKYEQDNEKELRDERQHGVDAPWVKFCSDEEGYPFPLGKRPRLGCRLIVKKYLRRYIKGLCKEFDSIEEATKERVSKLILFSIVYTEEVIVEYLDQVLFCFERELIKGIKGNKLTHIEKTLAFIGRFCDYDSITKLLLPTIEGDLNGNYIDMQRGGLICLKFIIKGHLDGLQQYSNNFGMFTGRMKEMLSVLSSPKFINGIDIKTSSELIDFYEVLTDSINRNKHKIKDCLGEFTQCLDLMFYHITQSLGGIDIKSYDVISECEKKLEKINDNVKMFKENFFSEKSYQTLSEISDYLETNFISSMDKNFKILFVFLRTKIFQNYNEDKMFLILRIINTIFLHDENYNIHLDTMKLLANYLSVYDENNKPMYQNEKIISLISEKLLKLFEGISKQYDKLEDEKFKYIDLLKDQKEVDKKRMKTSKVLKSELRSQMLILFKNILNQNNLFSNQTENNFDTSQNVLKEFLCFFNKDCLSNYVHENEANRRQFIELYYLFMIKYLTIVKDGRSEIKLILNNFEGFFIEEIYDPNVEIRQLVLTLFNLLVNALPMSEFFKPMCSMFEADKDKFGLESLKALIYVEEETKRVGEYFLNFKDVFSVLVNLYLDEKVKFGTQVEQAMRIIIQKFPVYTFNELFKATKKNQIGRIEFLDKMLKKFLK